MIDRNEYLDKLKFYKDKHIIKVITGVRRCGKSTLLEQFKDFLLSTNVKDAQIIFLNFEDLKYQNLCNYNELYSYIKNKLIPNKMNYVFLDEIQNVTNFEKVVDSLFIKENVDLYITGSNSYFLSGELATYLSGRYIEINMLPFSFKEYIEIENIADIKQAFNNYIEYGSFPFIHELNQNKNAINDYLNGIYSTILLKDIAKRKNIKDIQTLEDITRFLFDNIGNITSINKICNTLNSNGRSISVHTVETYIKALEDSFIIYKADRYDIKGKEHLKSLNKYYAVDIGIRNLLLNNTELNTGHILENIIYLELIRRGYKVNVGKIETEEIDFIATNSNGIEYYQVSASTLDDMVLTRELDPLNKIKDHNPKYLLTLDDLPQTSYNGIKRLNALDWLLNK